MPSSSDDDFGPFVGPLDPPPPSPEDDHKPHKKFLADAKANTARNRRAVLDELLEHQDDPLYWHKPSHSTLAPPIASTPTILSTPSSEDPLFSASSASWFATLQERIPSTHNPIPFTRSIFSSSSSHSTSHASSVPPTPFSTVRHSPSPFASHVFVPIPGAPAFKPEGYDWDKGFSDELEYEATASTITSHQEENKDPQLIFTEEPAPIVTKSPSPVNLGEYIEKKSGSVELVGRRISTVPVLTVAVADKMRPHLPALSRLPRTWSLIYSLDQHGISLRTLYSNCEAAAAAAVRSRSKLHGMIFVIKDSDGAIFGAWMSEGLRMSKGNEKYYGSGESFLWRWIEDGEELRVYKWTGKNDYVALCEPEFISFGGGDGSYGIYLDDTLYEGTSARSITFSNEVLCSPTGPRLAGGAVGFECIGVEVWGVG